MTKSAKKRFFNADNNNVPEQAFLLEQHKFKLDRTSQDNSFERDQQYEGINVTIDEKFYPSKHITTTYLWTNRSRSGKLSEPKVTTTKASWFREGNF